MIRITLPRTHQLSLLLLVYMVFPAIAAADATIISPSNGYTEQAEPCPNGPCGVFFDDGEETNPPFEVQTSGDPMDFVYLDFVATVGTSFSTSVCTPPDPIEGIPGCPVPPAVLSKPLFLRAGSYTVTARVVRGASEEVGPPITVNIIDWNGGTVGPVALSRVEPNAGAPGLTVRGDFPSGVISRPDTVRIYGDNLQNNPFLEVSMAPIPPNESALTSESALPVDDWCRYEATILNRNSGDSFLEVQLPELPADSPVKCGFSPGAAGPIFLQNWRFVIRDPWIRPERVHRYWAIPSPRDVPWKDAPPFVLTKPAYPIIDGFGFDNHSTDAKYNEFLTVYGNNAYYCVGALGVCATRLPKPLYHTMWWGLYKLFIDESGGSCNGMSATSLLMSREELQPEDYEADVHYPIGFDTPGPDSVPAVDKDGNPFQKGVAKYKDTNFCTPVCSPPKPDNLWAEIRKNHGVQVSKQFFFEMFRTLGTAVVDIGDITNLGDEELFKGIPNVTLDKVRSNPRGHVLCFTSTGGGHCVTPYKVVGNSIHVYDNNESASENQIIDIIDGDYDYPARSKDPNSGNFIIAYPISIWEEGRSLWGLGDFLKITTNLQTLEFLAMVIAGSADMVMTNQGGERFGWEDDGSFSRTMAGAMTVPSLGPSDEQNRNGLFFVSRSQPNPEIVVNADGGLYVYHTGAGDQLFQLEAMHAMQGDKDVLQLAVSTDRIDGFSFKPQRNAGAFVSRAGVDFGNEDGAVFSWLGLAVPGGTTAAFTADKDEKTAGYANDTGALTHHMMSLDYASGPADRHGRSIYGPFETPAGATHTVRLASWPEIDTIVSELDFDGDGTVDHTELVPGRPAASLVNPALAADLAVVKDSNVDTGQIGEAVTYLVEVINSGPEVATGAVLVDTLPSHVTISSIQTDRGSCFIEASGLRCDFGNLIVDDVVNVTYAATPGEPGSLANGAFVFSELDDPDWTNNSAIVTTDVPVPIDIKPDSEQNTLNPSSNGVTGVAILGSDSFRVDGIDGATLRFGPGASLPAHKKNGHLRDVNSDGIMDWLVHFHTRDAVISEGDTSACVSGMFFDGREFSGCDTVQTIPN